MEKYGMYIGSKWVEGHNTEDKILVENPATREIFAEVPAGDEADVNAAVEAAKEGMKVWKTYTPQMRADLLDKLADYFRDNADMIAAVVTKELGAPVKIAKDWHVANAEFETRFFADCARNYVYESVKPTYILRYEPFGIIAGITPWNYPLDQITLKILPALAAGNCVVLKPSQMTPLTAICFTKGIEAAGFPAGVFNLVTGRGGEVGNILAKHPDIRMISFTGSTTAGREVGRLALSNIKKTTLELGGKSAGIILPSADLRTAIQGILVDCMMNTGQTCNAMTRMLVPASEKEEAEKIAAEEVAKFKVGNPLDETVDIGPLINEKAYKKVKCYVEEGLKEGAKMISGSVPGEIKDGYFMDPVIFSDVTNDMKIAQEEIFGPVLCMITYETVEEAIEIANDSPYGLCGGVFGEQEEAYEVARHIDSGTITINGSGVTSEAPFGGYKQSGVGRENCIQSFEEYLEIKAICYTAE